MVVINLKTKKKLENSQAMAVINKEAKGSSCSRLLKP